MNTSKNLIQYFLSALVLVFVMQGCASMGSSKSNTRIYSKDFEESKILVQEGISNTNLGIQDISEGEGNQMTYYVLRHTSINDQSHHQERGKVIVTKVDDEHTRIEVENPKYHYTVPNFERKDYRQKLFRVFDKMFGENENPDQLKLISFPS